MKTLGSVLQDARVAKSLTQRKVAEAIGVSAMFVSEIEHGKKIPIKGGALKEIAKFFKIDFEELQKLAYETKLMKDVRRPNNPLKLKVALARRIMNTNLLDKEKIDQIMNILDDKED